MVDTATGTPTATPTPTATRTPIPKSNPHPSASATPYPTPVFSSSLGTNPVHSNFFLTSDHVRLHYLEAGKGLTLVFIPGWLLPAEIWKAQLEELSQDYHVVALDPRSQGQSDIVPRGNEPTRQARDIQELLDHLQLDSIVLAGWSHGAFSVLAYLNQFGTDRLYAAILVDSPLAAASNTQSTTSRERFLKQFKVDRPLATRNFVWGLFKKPPPGDFFHQIVAASSRTPTYIALALMNNAFPGDNWQPSLQTLCQIPLLYAVTPKYKSQSTYLNQVDPQARVEIFEHSGHALFFDEAERFNALVRNFLRHASLYPARLLEFPRAREKKD
jgi:microsomal epoxide hydrolase